MKILTIALRRSAVVTVAVLSLAIGAMSIRAAAAWTASSAPLNVTPVSAMVLVEQLSAEQTHSADLERQLSELLGQTTSLSNALTTAQDQVAHDAATAEALKAKLLAATKKLKALERSIRAAASRAGSVTTGTTATVSSSTSSGGGVEGGGDD